MVWPQTNRGVFAELYLGGAWVDVSADVYQRAGVKIRRGQANEGSRTAPGACTLELDNRTGKYSQRNPLGPYYGQLQRNTPIRVGIGTSYGTGNALQLTGAGNEGASVPDSAAVSITGDIDVRVDVAPTAVAWGSFSSILVQKYVGPSQQSYFMAVNSIGQIYITWSTDGTNVKTLTSAAGVVTGGFSRKSYRFTLDVDNGAGSHTATFYEATAITGPWSAISTVVGGAGATSIFDSTTPLRIGSLGTTAQISIFSAELRNGIAGTVVANPDFSAQTAGAGSFADGTGKTWTVIAPATIGPPPSEALPARYRFAGEVSSWPQSWDVTGEDASVKIEAAGLLQRLGQGAPLALSSMRSWVPKQTASTLNAQAYWPLEEGALAGSGAPDVGASPMLLTTTGLPTTRWGQGSLTDWLPACVSLDSGDVLKGSMSAPNFTTGYEFDFMFAARSGGSFTATVTESAGTTWSVSLNGTTGAVTVTKPDGATNTNTLSFDMLDAGGKTAQLRLTTSGANTNFNFVISNNVEGTGFFGTNDIIDDGFSGNVSGILPTAPVSVSFTHTGTAGSKVSIGHAAVFSTINSGGSLYAIEVPAAGNVGEAAGTRIARLCTEQAITLATTGTLTSTVKMGPQPVDTALALIQEAVDADGGVLLESRGVLGLQYLTRASLYNGSAAASASYSGHELAPPFAPVDDDQQTRNDITVRKSSGGEYRVQKLTGALSVLAPGSGGVGRYQESASLNVRNLTVASEVAGWLLALGTVDESRYPTISFNLANPEVVANTTLMSALLAIEIGQRLSVTGAAALSIYDTVNQLVKGYTERLNAFEHTLTFNCLPSSPYDVVVLDSSTLGKIDSGSSTLNGAHNSSTTSLSVATSVTYDLWGTGAVSIPITVGGEAMTVTNISGASSPQTFTVTRATNGVVKAQTSGSAVRLARRATIAL